MVYELTTEAIVIFAVFIIFIFVIYKLFRILLKAAIIAGAGFSFPWVMQKFGINLGIVANIDTGIEFATAAVIIYLIYEFSHFIKYFFKVMLWPFKLIKRRKR